MLSSVRVCAHLGHGGGGEFDFIFFLSPFLSVAFGTCKLNFLLEKVGKVTAGKFKGRKKANYDINRKGSPL